jgi:hypothetical protein
LKRRSPGKQSHFTARGWKTEVASAEIVGFPPPSSNKSLVGKVVVSDDRNMHAPGTKILEKDDDAEVMLEAFINKSRFLFAFFHQRKQISGLCH